METFDIIPSEITLEILIRLPTVSVLECKLVCTAWRNLISHHPSFSKRHLHHLNNPSADNSGRWSFLLMDYVNYGSKCRRLYYFEYDENHEKISRIRRIQLTLLFARYGVVGSINGLVCLYGSQDNEIYGPACICNPITRECTVLPKYASPINLRRKVLLGGFGYTNEYKVVRICNLKGEDSFVEVEVYTLGSGNGWRNLGKFNRSWNPSQAYCSFVNQALYWIDVEKMIVAFDLAQEKFRGDILPPCLPLNHPVASQLGVWDGDLLYVVHYANGDSSDIWVSKTKNDKHQSLGWSKEFALIKSDRFSFMKSGVALCCNLVVLFIK